MTYRIAALAAALLLSAGLIAAIEGPSAPMPQAHADCPAHYYGAACLARGSPLANITDRGAYVTPACSPNVTGMECQETDEQAGPEWMAAIKPAMEQASALTPAEKALQALAPVDPSPLGN